eukprot:TRINITY_DN100910_c0_g1_i1.p1 TRINITY_DN100910_c0_g1~~TRINITY_DN100910_c0_g1_i1.p1  ORF type:complete len:271 (-),score=18.74 TRINITY_DN100910_c0_g1_i1:696-1508(-)
MSCTSVVGMLGAYPGFGGARAVHAACRGLARPVAELDDLTDSTSSGGSSTVSTPFYYRPEIHERSLPSPMCMENNSLAAAVIVRNTFLDFESEEQASTRRRSRSAPPVLREVVFAVMSEDEIEAEQAMHVEGGRSQPPTEAAIEILNAASDSASTNKTIEQVRVPVGALLLRDILFASSSRGDAANFPLSENGEHPSNLPSVGSLAHYTGDCRPCGFFWKAGGCSNAADCKFCHICDAQEKKRRTKTRKNVIKAQALSQFIPCMSYEGDD